MRRLALLLLAVAVLGGAGLYWKFFRPSAAVPQAAAPAKGAGIPVKVGTVRTGEISEEISAVGSLIANESVMIRPERDGRITSIHFSEGQLVRKGEPLVSLDTAEIRAQLAASASELNLNRSRF